MERFVGKIKDLKGTFHDAIGLCVQNIDTVLGSAMNINGRVYVIIPREGKSSVWPLIIYALWNGIFVIHN